MRMARLDTTNGPRYAQWTGEAWGIVEDAFADPPVRTGVTVAADVLGYTVVNDVTNVDRNAADEKTFQGKGGYGYTPLGPWIETELADPENVATTVSINGRVAAQSGSFITLQGIGSLTNPVV